MPYELEEGTTLDGRPYTIRTWITKKQCKHPLLKLFLQDLAAGLVGLALGCAIRYWILGFI